LSHLVSILIPAYNAEKWIAATITSALDQTWPRKEIIIVDDGSSDNTLRIAKTFESKTVRVVTQRNAGACRARNEALGFAQGSYIQWLDADDLLSPNKISQQLNRSDNGLTSRELLTSAFGRFFFRQHKAKFKPDSLWQDLAPVDWILVKFIENAWMNPTSWLVSRKLTELTGSWDERLSASGDDDGEYVCRIVSKSENVKFVPEAVCYYRIGSTGGLNWKTSRPSEAFFLSLNLSINHLLTLENSERTRLACLTYLQRWLPVFYPENQDLLRRINNLARELGGTLLAPEVGRKYYPIKQIFGWRVAKKVSRNGPKLKLLARIHWDKLLYEMTCKTRLFSALLFTPLVLTFWPYA
jgi:glycosyltransferase involved in cell wall biosynthesis